MEEQWVLAAEKMWTGWLEKAKRAERMNEASKARLENRKVLSAQVYQGSGSVPYP
jgi:hypothetical protein